MRIEDKRPGRTNSFQGGTLMTPEQHRQRAAHYRASPLPKDATLANLHEAVAKVIERQQQKRSAPPSI